MQEYRQLMFHIIDGKGIVHKVEFSTLEGNEPLISLTGDSTVLLNRWNTVKEQIDDHVRNQLLSSVVGSITQG